MDSATSTTSEVPSQANSSQTNSLSAPSEENCKSSLSSSSVNFPQNEHQTPHSDEHVLSQSSNLPEQNTVTKIQLNLPDFIQNAQNNSCILNVFSSRLENEETKSDNGALIKNGAVESKPLVSNIPVNMKDSGNSSATTSSILNGDQLQLAQVNGHDTSSFIVVDQNLAGIPQITKQEEGSTSIKPVETSLKSMESKILETIIKLNEQLRNSSNCSSSAFPSTPSSSMTMPSTSGIYQGSGNQGLADNGNITSNNDNLPPVSIGACLMCGGKCDGDCDSENEDEQPFLPPPPLSSEEVDSLFAQLKEQDKETAAEPAAVINTKMFLHQKQALNWMINKENCTDLGPFWREHGQLEWFNEGTKTYTDVRPTCIKGGILADDMGLGKTLTIIALIFTNHLNRKPMFMKKETTTSNSKKRRASKTHTADNDEPKIKKPALDSSHDEEDVMIVKKEAREREKKAVAIKRRKEEIMNRKRVLEDKKGKDPGLKFRQIFLPKFLKNKDKQGNKVKKENIESSPVQKCISIDVTQPSTSKANHDVILVNDDDDDDDSSDELTVVDAAPSTPMRPKKLLAANPVPSGAAKATLIICPLSVLSNWTDQICTHVNPAVNLHVYMYYGAQRIKDLKYLRSQDIVLTTYPTVANDFRTNIGTDVEVPSSPGVFRVMRRSKSRNQNGEPKTFHIRGTSDKPEEAQSSSPLHNIKWLRIVLDEGHTIRNKRTTLSKAVLELDAERRWVVTGTPIQNRIDDLRTIILYLRLEPFNDNRWWKKSIENLRKKQSDLADFRLNTLIKHVSIRRLKDDKVDNSKLVELPPKQVVIQDIELSEEERKFYDMLQRDGQSIIKRYLRHDSVLKHYGHCFAILMRLRQMCLHPRLCKEAVKELKQAVDSAKDVDEAVDDGDDDGSQARLIKVLMEAISSGDSEECAICLESLNDPVVTPCAHVFCCACITDVLNTEGLAPKCPMCRAPVDETDLLRVPEEQLNKNNKTTIDVDEDEELKDSAKIRALIGSLKAIRDKDPSTKSVVVSQFTSFLNIIEEYLEKHRFEYLRLDGTMRLDERLKALEDFNEPGSPATVFLLSMSAGGTGLNLTAASRVFLMDPAWNPAVEEQCFDRCHRMGQTKEVIITKYIVMDSVEERMLTLQGQKRQLMSQAFGAKAQSQEDRSRARVRDIAHLIGLRPVQQQAGNRGTQ